MTKKKGVTVEVAKVRQRARKKVQAGGVKNICWIQIVGEGGEFGENTREALGTLMTHW